MRGGDPFIHLENGTYYLYCSFRDSEGLIVHTSEDLKEWKPYQGRDVTLGIKTVVNLRDNHSDSDEIGGLPLKARRIEIFTGNMKDKYVTDFLSVLDDTNAVPVLVHCQHGADRTGTMCAMYRILREGWTVDDAIDEMKNGGFGYHSVWGNLPRFIRKSAERRARAGVVGGR